MVPFSKLCLRDGPQSQTLKSPDLMIQMMVLPSSLHSVEGWPITSYSGDGSVFCSDMYVLSSWFGFTFFLVFQRNITQIMQMTLTMRDMTATAQGSTALGPC